MTASKNRTIENAKKDFELKIKKTIEGLEFISETDAEFETYSGPTVKKLTRKSFIESLGEHKNEQVEERDFEEFFARLTVYKDWYTAREKKTANRFSVLEKLLKDSLRDLKVFRVGKIRIEIFIVGLNSENQICGVKTHAVET